MEDKIRTILATAIDQGKSLYEISRLIGRSIPTVRKLIHMLGLSARWEKRNRRRARRATLKERMPRSPRLLEFIIDAKKLGYKVYTRGSVRTTTIEGVPILFSQRKTAHFTGSYHYIQGNTNKTNHLVIVILPTGHRWFVLPQPEHQVKTLRWCISLDKAYKYEETWPSVAVLRHLGRRIEQQALASHIRVKKAKILPHTPKKRNKGIWTT